MYFVSEGHDAVAVAQPALLTEVSPASGGLHRGTSLLRGATDVRARKFVCGHGAREMGARPCAKIRCPLLRSAGMPFPLGTAGDFVHTFVGIEVAVWACPHVHELVSGSPLRVPCRATRAGSQAPPSRVRMAVCLCSWPLYV